MPAMVQEVKEGEEKYVTAASGVRSADKRIGGGASVNRGMLVVLDYR